METIRFRVVWVIGLWPVLVHAQSRGWEGATLVWEKEIPAEGIALDKLGQVYVLAPGNRLLRFGTDGAPKGEFVQPALGRLGGIDIGDPLSPLLWYPDFQAMVLLDRTMGFISTIYLPDEYFVLPVLVARGRDNRIWVFDNFHNRLICVDPQGRVQAQSQELNLGGQSPSAPQFLVADETGFYLSDSLHGIWQFDLLGQFQFFIPIKQVEALLLMPDQKVVLRKEGKWFLLSGQGGVFPFDFPFDGQRLALQPQTVVTWDKGLLRYYRK